MKIYSGFFGLVLILTFFSCNREPEKQASLGDKLKKHVFVLASDSLQGREAGSQGAAKARKYIVSELKAMGLKPFFGDSYTKAFEFKDGADYSESTLTINGKEFEAGKDFYPLNKSKSGSVSAETVFAGYGIMSSKPSHNDYTDHAKYDWKVFVMEMSVPGGYAHWDDYAEHADLDKRIELAVKFGAKAIIFVNSDSTFDDPRKMISNTAGHTPVPVIIADDSLRDYLFEHPQADISLNVKIKKLSKKGYNIAALIDNGASSDIIIGAHYDHLGMGGETSRYHGPPAVHNGADDNASGVAAVLELARKLKNLKLKHNIIVMSFSGEEKGLLGSSALIKQGLIDPSRTLCMLNFDMVGRMDSAKDLTIFGTGTASQWDSIMSMIHNSDSLNIKKAATGIGGSDQMSFYLDSIPVLFFFTGFHDDYHTPDDDADRINYKGIEMVRDYAFDIIENLDNIDTLSYRTAKARSGGNHNYRKGPTLGIVPDYAGDGSEGMMIQAVLDNRPAQKAGLIKGDILVKLGDTEIKDIYDYMDALKKCSKGKSYPVEVVRKGKKIKTTIQF